MTGLGTIINTAAIIAGGMIGIENGFERFGEWLKKKTGNSASCRNNETTIGER